MTQKFEIDFANTLADDGLSDPDKLVEAARNAVETTDWSDGVGRLAEVGAPTLDLVVTPMSARASLLGMAEGKGFYHHELRRRVPMPPELEPALDVWEGETLPIWRDGVLEEPKYFSFFQEAPLASYNPNHRRKWRAHELLHGAVGFFWRPDLTRFEAYLSARLNELLPVVHWYGFDEIFRPRCSRHVGEVLYREGCRECEDAARPFWEFDPTDRLDEALAFARTANEHYRREMEACRTEIETGEVRETPRGRLDASSDAVGYLEAHWNRMTAWSFGAWLERFLQPGIDYAETTRDLYDRVESTYQGLVSGPLGLDLDDFERLRDRRALQDVAYRLYLAMEWVDPESNSGEAVEKALEPALEVLHASCESLLAEPGSIDAIWRHVDEAVTEAEPHLPEAVVAGLRASGFRFDGRDADSAETSFVQHGLETACPAVFAGVDEVPVEAFVASDRFDENGLIGTRFARFLADEGEEGAELAAFEAWTLEPPRRDRGGELFGALIDDETDVTAGELRLNTTWRQRTFDGAALESVLALGGAELELAAYIWRGELRIVVVEPQIAAVVEAVEAGRRPADMATVEGLNAEGALIWLPSAR